MSGDQLDLNEHHLNMIEDAADRARGIPGADTLATIFVPALVAELRRLRATCIPVPEGLDHERAAGALWRLACAPLQWVTGPYPDDWPLEGRSLTIEPWNDEPDLDTHETDALREFQRANGLTVDGILGPQTWEALRARNESHPYDR